MNDKLMRFTKYIYIENAELKLGIKPVPTPNVGEVLIRVKAIGVNRADILQVQGLYPAPDNSNIPGLELAGIREDNGEKICALLPGGGYSEFVCVPEDMLIPIPEDMDFIHAAAIPEAIVTIWSNLYLIGKIQSGQQLLLHGGASGIGIMAVQFALNNGCTVFTTASTINKLKIFEHYKNCHIVSYNQNYVEIINNAGGVDLVLDILGGKYLPYNLKVLKPQGKLIILAVMNNSIAEINLASVLMKNLTVTGSTVRSKSNIEKAELIKGAVKNLLPMIQSKQVKPVIDSIFGFDDVKHAHQKMQNRQHIGKIVLVCNNN